ncbi:AfsR/SARP family transcriptional regulator, partial [Actinomadura adrarensis]
MLAGLHSASLVAGALRWERLQLTAAEETAEVELALGRHQPLIDELTDWVAEYPFNERLRALLMTALIRTGRHRDALEVYSEGRRALREGLDLTPGRELRTLYESILLNGSWRQVPNTSSTPPVPNQHSMPDADVVRSSGGPSGGGMFRAPSGPRGRCCAGAVPRVDRWRSS